PQDVDKSSAVEAELRSAAQFGLVEGRDSAVDDQVAAVVVQHDVAIGRRRLAAQVLQLRYPQPEQVELAGDKSQLPRRGVRDDRRLDAVEIGPARLPVIRVAQGADMFVGL